MSGRTAFWGDLARNRELGECVPLSGKVTAQLVQFCQTSEELLPNLRPRRQALQGRCSHLALQFQIELVEELGFGFEVREQRAIWNTCLFAIPAVGALSPCATMMRVAAFRMAIRFSSLRGLGMAESYWKASGQSTINFVCRFHPNPAALPSEVIPMAIAIFK